MTSTTIEAYDTYAVTRAALSPDAGGTYKTIIVRGGLTPGDGADGIFYWDATSNAADDGALVLQPSTAPTTGRWHRHHNGEMNLLWFVTAADGSDRAAAMRRARVALVALGGGSVFIPPGIHLLSTLEPGTNSFCLPASNVTWRGSGDTSVLRIADSMNEAIPYGWLVWAPANPTDPASPAITNAVWRNFTIDCNAAANSGHQYVNGVIVLVNGSDPVVENVTFLNHPGTQIVSFATNVARPVIWNNHFFYVGDTVNPAITDHSSIYCHGPGAIVTGNILFNSVFSTKATAIECHGGGIVTGNHVHRYVNGANIVAELANNHGCVISNNKWEEVSKAVTFWVRNGYSMQGIVVQGNVGLQSESSPGAFYDLGENIDASGLARDFTFTGNSSSSFADLAGQPSVGISIGCVQSVNLSGNTWNNFVGRAISLGNILPYVTSVSIIGDVITDCGRTADTNFKQGIALHSFAPLASIVVDNVTIKNIAAPFMTTGIAANAPIADGRIGNVYTYGIAIPRDITGVGISPVGFSVATPALPGTSYPTRRFNTNKFPARVYFNGGSGITKIDAKGSFADLGVVQQLVLQPGDSIYATTTPTSWIWEGL